MGILLIFAFISGLVTILAPCIWPLLPIILSATGTGGKKKPLGITLGIITSFAFFTLTISYLVKLIPFNPDALRIFAVVIIGFLGLTFIIPALARQVEGLVSSFSRKLGVKPQNTKDGFWGGFLTGAALGVVWTPCAGPILATIATLAATRSVNLDIILVTVVYVIGVGIPLFLFSLLGQKIFSRTRQVSGKTGQIQQIFGVIMIITALLIATNYDKVLQAKLLDAFPSYSQFIIKLESDKKVQDALNKIKNGENEKKDMLNKAFSPTGDSLPNLGPAPEFAGIYKWLNPQKPVSIKDLKGKVVLVDFWTYTCINCIRTLPHVTEWYNKYKDKGFVVVGVHTPEFEFEKNTQNVLNAIAQYKIHYPVAQDNEFDTWNAYDNHYWPAKYLIDRDGNIRYTHFGEGEYDTTEHNIQLLLEEAGQTIKEPMANLKDETPTRALTPETYIGLARLARFGSDEQAKEGVQNYSLSTGLPEHYFSIGGKWNLQQEYGESTESSMLELSFYADKVFLVITPKTPQDVINVYIDGKKVDSTNAGSDVKNGSIVLSVPRLYNLVNLHGKTGSHTLRLEFKSGGTKVFAFTFG